MKERNVSPMSIKQELINLLNRSFYNESDYTSALMGIIYRKYQGNTLKLFLEIQEMDRQRIEYKNQLLYRGLEDGMHLFSQLAQLLQDNRDSRKAKNRLEIVFSNSNPSFLINICKAYFTRGTAEGASRIGQWFFEKFKTMLEDSKESYQEGGSNYEWAESQDHLDYINLVLNHSS